MRHAVPTGSASPVRRLARSRALRWGVGALEGTRPWRRGLRPASGGEVGRERDARRRAVEGVGGWHLGNGARVERINWLGDPSAKGLKQSWGLMVNYYYDLRRLDKHRALLAQGKMAVSSAVESLRE